MMESLQSDLNQTILDKDVEKFLEIFDKLPNCELATALHHALIFVLGQKDKDTMEIFLEIIFKYPECDINNKCYIGDKSLLHYTASLGFLGAAKQLLSRDDCDVNQTNRYGQTVFIGTVLFGYSEILEALLADERIDPSIQDRKGRTALFAYAWRAARRADVRLKRNIHLLMNNEKFQNTAHILDDNGESPLSRFLKGYGNESSEANLDYYSDIIDLLLLGNNAVNAAKDTLAIAIEKAPLEICRKLFEHSADVQSSFEDGETALHCAVRLESLPKIALLLSYNADVWVKYKGLTPVELALAHGSNAEILQILTDKMPVPVLQKLLLDTAFAGETALTCSIRLGVKEWIKCFIEDKHITALDGTGVSPLQLSCKSEACQSMVQDRFGSKIYESPNLEPFKKWYKTLKLCSASARHRTSQVQDDKAIRRMMLTSGLPNNCDEANQIVSSVLDVAMAVSFEAKKVKKYAHLIFRPVLAGSRAEGTKTFVPNEVDIICVFEETDTLSQDMKYDDKGYITVSSPSPWLPYADSDGYIVAPMLADNFYTAFLHCLTRIISSGHKFGHLHLKSQCLHFRDKISYLQLLWRGQKYKDLMVYIDLVPAFKITEMKNINKISKSFNPKTDEYHLITKTSRRGYNHKLNRQPVEFTVSFAMIEINFLKALPKTIKEGLIFAKALRTPHISGTGPNTIVLRENKSFEDVITSYMLKNALMHILSRENQEHDGDSFFWAGKIYQRIAEGDLKAFFNQSETLIKCSHGFQREPARDSCCEKKELILAMCENIQFWLRNNGQHLCIEQKELIEKQSCVVYDRSKYEEHLNGVNLGRQFLELSKDVMTHDLLLS